MKVKLISYSQHAYDPAIGDEIESDLYNIQDLVAYCARVSNPGNQSNTETSDRLLRYLIKNKHWSPFEMVSACLEITTTRDIARQILRHRSFSFQEFSQRYADPIKELSFVLREARLQDPKNRQNSTELDYTKQDHRELARWFEDKQHELLKLVKEIYTTAIASGIAKEQARAIFPEGLTMSRMYVNGTLRSWIHYIELRSANGTQLEHMEIAKMCAEVISKVFPQIREHNNEY
ncbi:MAG: FAD-dependent thymidylate synthase [Alphaproteobacteria bacterium]|nr:FAD-dependent thymidylate synthase [Alphaproteobacteria bacterium]